MEITLIRHGQSEHNAGLTMFLDSHLTESGLVQARRTADRLKGEKVTRGYVSPLRRTLETMAPIASEGGFPVQIDPLLSEYFSSEEYRTFPGMTVKTILQDYPYATISDTVPNDGPWWTQELEGRMEIFERCVRFKTKLRQTVPADSHILIVSHAETIGRLIEALIGIEPNLQRPPWSDNCGISRLSWSANRREAEIKYLNDTGHLVPGLVNP